MIRHHLQVAYPQALSVLIRIFKDVNIAEEALQSAAEKALHKWPHSLPSNTVAWLVSVGKYYYLDQLRKTKPLSNWDNKIEPVEDIDLSEKALTSSYPDDMLRLIFTCCHPALDKQTQLELALKHVLGLSVAEIARALLVNPKTMEKRLTRAKLKIAKAGILYQIPPESSWDSRLEGVMKTIYLLFNEGYLSTSDEELVRKDLCKEAIRLARVLNTCVKQNADIIGLLALLLQQNARQSARINEKGEIVLLPNQNRALWCQISIQEGNVLVEKALKISGQSAYAIQAAIAALHNNAEDEDSTDWLQIYGLYQALRNVADSPIVKLNAAVALAKSGEISTALTQIKELEDTLKDYRYYWSTFAGLYFEQGQWQLAHQYYHRALKLILSPLEQKFIHQQIQSCEQHVRDGKNNNV